MRRPVPAALPLRLVGRVSIRWAASAYPERTSPAARGPVTEPHSIQSVLFVGDANHQAALGVLRRSSQEEQFSQDGSSHRAAEALRALQPVLAGRVRRERDIELEQHFAERGWRRLCSARSLPLYSGQGRRGRRVWKGGPCAWTSEFSWSRQRRLSQRTAALVVRPSRGRRRRQRRTGNARLSGSRRAWHSVVLSNSRDSVALPSQTSCAGEQKLSTHVRFLAAAPSKHVQAA